ncbi:hypothetical protein TNCV_4425201 [Trichonephila clavipes]|nr:hypothetical protein TNCV_4425201 [Trichonephila clavipes]
MPKMQTSITCTVVEMRIHRQLRETPSFHIPRRDTGQRTAERRLSLKESIWNVVVDRPVSSTRAVADRESVSHQTVC